jgi:vitamin K-dependent gamma-carboxylase
MPVDLASLVFFRVAFGSLMIWHVWHFFSEHRIASYWLEPRFLFKYYGFSWIQPWPGNGLYIHCAVLGVLALFITVGLLYRVSATLFCLGYTYTFLLDEARWVNHTYLICLLSFLLIFVPANRALAIDAWLFPKKRAQTTPAWTLWLLRVQVGVVYFFAGVAKLSPDWLHGEPMRIWLILSDQPPAIARFLRQTWVVYSFSYASLTFDLFVVPFLLWRRTRLTAFGAAVLFHFLNSQLFPLEVFPWLALAGTTLFLSPDWPRRIISIFWKQSASSSPRFKPAPPNKRRQSIILTLAVIYALIQILVPLRHFIYRGGAEWFDLEHRFSWRMMLESHWVRAYFYVTDPNVGRTYEAIEPRRFLDPNQVRRMGWRPDLILQFAHFLARELPQAGPEPLRVEARVFAAINGRKPQLVINPNVDLAAEPRTLGRPRWLLEIHQHLPNPPPDPKKNPFESPTIFN